MSRTLEFALRGAGLLPVTADVAIPVLALQSWSPAHPDRLTPAETRPSGALADLYYFWMPECEACLDGLGDLAPLKADSSLTGVLGIHAVVMESDLTSLFAADARASGWTREVLVDPKGGFAERLGVLGAPGVLLGDARGHVVARFNGEIDFASPGFALLVATLKKKLESQGEPREVESKTKGVSLASELRAEVKETPSARVSFLGVPLAGYIFLFALLLICYPMAKSVIRLRKNPK